MLGVPTMCSTNSHHAPTADNQTVNGLRIVIDLTLTHTDSSNTQHNQTPGLDTATGHGTAPPEKRGYLALGKGSGEPSRPSSNKRHRTAPELEAPQQQPASRRAAREYHGALRGRPARFRNKTSDRKQQEVVVVVVRDVERSWTRDRRCWWLRERGGGGRQRARGIRTGPLARENLLALPRRCLGSQDESAPLPTNDARGAGGRGRYEDLGRHCTEENRGARGGG